ncbi:MAG: hypothetical protein PWP08_943 [Methanofollis sp.]|nr:hypothetical protein [Methanofollis sp.]
MSDKCALNDLDGNTVQEKFAALGIEPGASIDILELQRLSRCYDVRSVVYFEEEMAKKGDLEGDDLEYAGVPESERPFISVEAFLTFAREFDPYSFDLRLQELPIMIEIVMVGEIRGRPYFTGVMPFLDELENFEEPEISG